MTKKTYLLDSEKLLVGIGIETNKDKFIIPVVDVRRSEDKRRIANKINKASNAHRGSKYMKPSFAQHGLSYQTSHKK